MKTKQLIDRRAELWDQMKAIVTATEEANAEELTVSQRRDYEKLEQRFTELSEILEDGQEISDEDPITRHKKRAKRMEQVEPPDAAAAPLVDPYGTQQRTVDGGIFVRSDESVEAHLRKRRAARGQDDPESDGPLSFGKMMRGYLSGDWKDAEPERRALGESTDGSGGIFVPTLVSAQIIDKARAKTAALRAGVTTVLVESDKMKIPRVVGDPSATWLTENTAATESDLTFDGVTLDSQALVIGPMRSSLQLIEDAEGLEELIEETFAKVMALKLDAAILRGSGTAPEPRGIRNTTGVTIQDMGLNGAALTNYDPFLTAVQTVRTFNAEPNAVVYHPRTAGSISKLKDSQQNPMTVPDDFADLDKFTTTQIPINITSGTSTDTSEAYVGDWSDVVLGIRTNLRIKKLDERYAEFLQAAWIGYLRADVVLRHPESFVVITGIRP